MTGLEPATSGVTGRHSNQLSYTRVPLGEPRLYGSTDDLSTGVRNNQSILLKSLQNPAFANRLAQVVNHILVLR